MQLGISIRPCVREILRRGALHRMGITPEAWAKHMVKTLYNFSWYTGYDPLQFLDSKYN